MTLLQPGYCVKWQEDGVWKMGRVMMDERPEPFVVVINRDDWGHIVQALDGLHVVNECDLKRVETRTD